MAYFECVIGGGGTSLTIQITTSSTALYGQTITISKGGSTVGTTTFDNTGYAEYTVREAGQYTVTCQGYSSIIDVSNEFPVEIDTTKTITVTIYSAANDTVSFTDATGAKTATTNSSGVASNIRITFRESSPTVTFTSSVAKNPSNLSQNYSRGVSLTTSTTEIAVMPVARSKVLYWWGYESANLEDVSTANGWTHSYSFGTPTHNTTNITMASSSGQNLTDVGMSKPATIKKLHAVARSLSGGANTTAVILYSSKNLNVSPIQIEWFTNTSDSHIVVTLTNAQSAYAVAQANSGGTNVLSAMWYE